MLAKDEHLAATAVDFSTMARNAQMLIDLASEILLSVSTSEGIGLRNQIYSSSCPPPMIPMLTSMVNGASTNKDTLLACAEEDGLFAALPADCQPIEDHMSELQVTLYECLLGSRRVRGTSPINALVKGRKASLQKTLASRRKRGATNKFVEKKTLPRFVRVNTLKTTLADTIAYLITSHNFTQVFPPSTSTNVITPLAPRTFTLDPHLPNVLHLPSKTNLHGDDFVESGKLIMQDRSSCLTAIALSPPAGSVCIDTCSAPGNKTLHLASIIKEGKIIAFERSPSRLNTLKQRVRHHGAGHIIAEIGADFTETSIDDQMFKDVTHILIDPSCSGSGLVTGIEANGEAVSEHDSGGSDPNLPTLTMNQLGIINHAMRLPKAKAVAYSTCSVYKEENEEVVASILKSNPDWECVECLPQWPHRGLEDDEFKDFASKVVRATYEKDTTNGFFVARFEKKEGGGEMTEEQELKAKKKREKKEKKEKKKRKAEEEGEEEGEKKVKKVKKSKKEKKAKKEKT